MHPLFLRVVTVCVITFFLLIQNLKSQAHTERAINQQQWRTQMFSDLNREFYNIPFLTWKRINTLTSTLSKKDAIRKIKHILKSFEEENLTFF